MLLWKNPRPNKVNFKDTCSDIAEKTHTVSEMHCHDDGGVIRIHMIMHGKVMIMAGYTTL